MTEKLLGEILIEKEIITQTQLEEALARQKQKFPNKKIGEILVRLGHIAKQHIFDALVIQSPEKDPDLIQIEVFGGGPYTTAEDLAGELMIPRQPQDEAAPPCQETPENNQAKDWVIIELNGFSSGPIQIAQNASLDEILRQVNIALAETCIEDFERQIPPQLIKVDLPSLRGLAEQKGNITDEDIKESERMAAERFPKEQAAYEAARQRAEECRAFLEHQKMIAEEVEEICEPFEDAKKKSGNIDKL